MKSTKYPETLHTKFKKICKLSKMISFHLIIFISFQIINQVCEVKSGVDFFLYFTTINIFRVTEIEITQKLPVITNRSKAVLKKFKKNNILSFYP